MVRIVVLGAGAMGSLFGALLKESGNEVWLLDTWREHVDRVNAEGLYVTGLSGDRTVAVPATADPREAGVADLVIVFVKSYNTSTAVRDALAVVGDNTVFLTLQNGLGNVEEIARYVGESRILVGVTSLGATVLAPGRVRHDGDGDTYVGEVSGKLTPRVTAVVDMFNEAGIRTHGSDNVMGLVWSKLLQNAGINAVSAVTRLRNGKLLEFPHATELMLRAVAEGAEIAHKKGIRLVYDDALENVKRACRLSCDKISSMLQDILKERQTEIGFINGRIVEEGKKEGVPTPTNEMLTLLIKALEESYEDRVR